MRQPATPQEPKDNHPAAGQTPGLAPAGLWYTLLRHGRGLSHEEAAHRQRETLREAAPPAA